MKVSFIGAGPGDPELITLKGKKRLEQADILIYAGSLVSPALLDYCSEFVQVYDSAAMNLDEVTGIYYDNRNKNGLIVRLHTGDPSVYGAIQEQMDFLDEWSIAYEVVPGVSSFQGSAAALKRQLTLPGISQTVILTRIAGRTAKPEGEALEELARSRSTMILFLSVDRARDVRDRLLPSYGEETPVAVVYRATWPDEIIVRGKLGELPELVERAGIFRQALIFVGNVLDCQYEKSKLYDAAFSHGFREADL